ncbi:hypothetical protein H0H93_004837, partial [Arthromyces matolae]
MYLSPYGVRPSESHYLSAFSLYRRSRSGSLPSDLIESYDLELNHCWERIIYIFLSSVLLLSAFTSGLEISLRETKPNTADWHFALVIHQPNDIIPKPGKPLQTFEHLIDRENGCFEFATRSAKTHEGHIAATATVLPANGEANDEVLSNNLEAIFRSVVPSAIHPDHDFNNCLDFAVEAVRRMHSARYVDANGLKKFEDVKADKGAAVSAKTGEHTRRLCRRGNDGACEKDEGKRQPRSGSQKARLQRRSNEVERALPPNPSEPPKLLSLHITDRHIKHPELQPLQNNDRQRGKMEVHLDGPRENVNWDYPL